MELKAYHSLFTDIKQKIQKAQLKAIISVNAEMIFLYWQIGKSIDDKQSFEGWSSKIIPKLSKDLKSEFPDAKGYSERNLGYMLRFAKEYPNETILQQAFAKIPWGHNLLLIEIKNIITTQPLITPQIFTNFHKNNRFQRLSICGNL